MKDKHLSKQRFVRVFRSRKRQRTVQRNISISRFITTHTGVCNRPWGHWVEMSTTASPETPTNRSVTKDDCFELLSNHRRRYAIHHLQQNGTNVSLSELSEQVAAWENDIAIEEVSYDERKRVYTSLQQVHLPRMDKMDVVEYDERKRVYTSLQQVHLPRMDKMDVVEYDERDGSVALGPAAEEIDFYLEVVADDDVPWSHFYLGLALVNAGLLFGALLGLGPLVRISGLGWAVFAVTSFLVTSLSHMYITRTEMRLGETDKPPELLE